MGTYKGQYYQQRSSKLRAMNKDKNARDKEDAVTRGYPKSGDSHQKKAAANNYSNSASNRGYPQSGDKYQKEAAGEIGYGMMHQRIEPKKTIKKVSGGGVMHDNTPTSKKILQNAFKKRVGGK